MYAALDTADRVAWSTADPFQHIANRSEKRYLAAVTFLAHNEAAAVNKLHLC